MIYLDRGYIGCFEMRDKKTGKEQLEKYVTQLKDAGHTRIIAPIDGDTWHKYRAVSWSNGEAPFPLEPQNPLWYNEVFNECGFKPLHKYSSYKFSLDNVTPLAKTDKAFNIRNFRESDLRIIYDISLQEFNENFLYTDITFEEFSKLYEPLLPMLDEELTVIAEIDGNPVGFAFSFAISDTVILKTLAVRSEFRSSGIGAVLINHVLLVASQKGIKHAVAALMADGNNSLKIASKYEGEKIREYILYCLEV